MAEKTKAKKELPKKQTKYCEGCGRKLHTDAKSCPHCGKELKSTNGLLLAVVGLIINVFVLPGVGTIIGGNISTGVTQIVLFFIGAVLLIIGIPLLFVLVGILFMIGGALLMVGVWVWALVSSISQIIKAKK